MLRRCTAVRPPGAVCESGILFAEFEPTALRGEKQGMRFGIERLHESPYDVQDLLHALLKIDFDDVRPEEWTPSYAGKSSRTDFLLKNEKIVVETKKTRNVSSAKSIGDELIIDIARYREHPDCAMLVSFIYPDGYVQNPEGLKSDLEKGSDSLTVRVIIAPKIH
jgi:hypothetical protein